MHDSLCVCVCVCVSLQALRLSPTSPPPPRIALNTMTWSVTEAMLSEIGRMTTENNTHTNNNDNTGTHAGHGGHDNLGSGTNAAVIGSSGNTDGQSASGAHTGGHADAMGQEGDQGLSTTSHRSTDNSSGSDGATQQGVVCVGVKGVSVVVACHVWGVDPPTPVEDVSCRPGGCVHAHIFTHAHMHTPVMYVPCRPGGCTHTHIYHACDLHTL